MLPAFQDRDARLALMDEQGVESTIMLPTLAVTVEHFMRDDIPQTYANLEAFNKFVDEDWGFAYQDRIFSPELIRTTANAVPGAECLNLGDAGHSSYFEIPEAFNQVVEDFLVRD